MPQHRAAAGRDGLADHAKGVLGHVSVGCRAEVDPKVLGCDLRRIVMENIESGADVAR